MLGVAPVVQGEAAGHRVSREAGMKQIRRRWRMWRFDRWQKRYLEDRDRFDVFG